MNWTWIVTAFGILGMVLNIKKRKECFYVWGCTNIAWTVIDIQAGVYSQALLQMIFFGASVWGIYEWRKRR